MLEGAVEATGGGFTLHSDRGWHYRTPDWVRDCAAAGVTRSMSRKGHSPDNAACEGFFGRLKVEFFFGRDWSGVTAEGFMEAARAGSVGRCKKMSASPPQQMRNALFHAEASWKDASERLASDHLVE